MNRLRNRWAEGRVFLPVLLLLLLITPAVLAAQTAAVVKSVSGAAFAMENNEAEPKPLRVGTEIPSGWMITTSNGTLLRILLPDSHLVTLGPAATTVRWTGGRMQSSNVTVTQGQTTHSVSRLTDQASYRVTTPSGIAGVRGTEFTVLVGENGSSKTKVSQGEVLTGEETLDRPLGPGAVDEARLTGSEQSTSNDSEWLAAQTVSGPEEAAEIEAAATERMERTNRMTLEDLAEMAVLGRDIAVFAARRPSDLGDAAAALDLLVRGLDVYRRMETRKEAMEARREVTRNLAARHAISDATSDSQYRSYTATRQSKSAAIEGFIANLEKLSGLIKAARVANSAPVGIIRNIPFRF